MDESRNRAPVDAVVVGGGPAGCCVAMGLRELGYEVQLLTTRRPWPSCEGISARTLQGLRSAGLGRALARVGEATPRLAHWNGMKTEANTEHLVRRRDFDRALLEDVGAAGIPVLNGRLLQREAGEDGIHRLGIRLDDAGPAQLACRFFVDARGRGVPAREAALLRGPETVSLVQVRQGPVGEAGSLVCSYSGGWAWLARLADGSLFVQLTVEASERTPPKRARLAGWFEEQLRGIPDLHPWLENTAGVSPIFARGSTSLLRDDVVTAAAIRVGDAAMAVDPLSGNGIFQALSSALAAPAVINTLLRHPDDGALAQTFYRERVYHTFMRFARTGRDFYRLEQERGDTPFWQARQRWPDDQLAHPETAPEFLGLRERPVLEGDRIRSRRVAVTSDQPLGVWHVDGVELAPLLQDLPAPGDSRTAVLLDRVRRASNGDQHRAQHLTAWLRHYALL
ncbi:MAG: FAD-dependent monooxygenase [Halioglobus sp.]